MADLRESSRKLAMVQLQEKSDSELSQILKDNANKALAAKNAATLEQILGESDACLAILSQRKERQANIEQTEKMLKTEIESLIKKGDWILSCPTSASPNGQLIAAILEDEDRLTPDEIGTWCEELSTIPEEQLKIILNDMVSEGVLHCDNKGKYHLWRLCSGNIYPDDPQQWLCDKIADMPFGDDEYNRLVAKHFRGLMTADDLWTAWVIENRSIKDLQDFVLRGKMLPSIQSALEVLCDKGMLAKYPVKGEYDDMYKIQQTYVYDYPIFGQEKVEITKGGDGK